MQKLHTGMTAAIETREPALFIGLLVPALKTRPAALAAVSGAAVTLLFAGIPNRGGMLIGGVVGVIAGTWADLRSSS